MPGESSPLNPWLRTSSAWAEEVECNSCISGMIWFISAKHNPSQRGFQPMALKGHQERIDSEYADNLMRIEPHEKAYVHDGHQDTVTQYLESWARESTCPLTSTSVVWSASPCLCGQASVCHGLAVGLGGVYDIALDVIVVLVHHAEQVRLLRHHKTAVWLLKVRRVSWPALHTRPVQWLRLGLHVYWAVMRVYLAHHALSQDLRGLGLLAVHAQHVQVQHCHTHIPE